MDDQHKKKQNDKQQQGQDDHHPISRHESNNKTHSCPRLPELALTSSTDSKQYQRLEIPSFERNQYHHQESNSPDQYSDADTDINEAITPDKSSLKSYFSDGDSSSTAFAKLQDTNISADSTDALVEAAINKAEAQDRHVRFHNHVAESAALVQRMLSVKSGHNKHPPRRLAPQDDGAFHPFNTANNKVVQHEYDIEMDNSASSAITGADVGSGSVLASLMKLEAVNRRSSTPKKKKRYSYAGNKKVRKKRDMCLY
jgi:hypothetical protein